MNKNVSLCNSFFNCWRSRTYLWLRGARPFRSCRATSRPDEILRLVKERVGIVELLLSDLRGWQNEDHHCHLKGGKKGGKTSVVIGELVRLIVHTNRQARLVLHLG